MQVRHISLLLLCIALLTSACARPLMESDADRQQRILAEAEAESAAGEHASAARRVEALLPELPRDEQIDAALQAAEYWLQAERMRQALDLTRRLDGLPLSTEQVARRYLIYTEVLTRQGRHAQAADYIPEPLDELPPGLHQRGLKLRAEIRIMQGEVISGLNDLQRRETLLKTTAAREQHLQATWQLLSSTPTDLSLISTPSGTDPVVAAWLELGMIAQQRWRQPQRFRESLRHWRDNYPQHPASRQLVEDILDEHRRQTDYPQRIAVLLPLSGRFTGPAHAVRDGLMAAHYEQGHQQQITELRVYDTGDFAEDILDTYSLAIEQGADFVIGPLSRDALAILAEQRRPAVPTLALNRLDPEEHRIRRRDLFQFSLDPEDEARQVAERATLDGHARAVALVQRGDWGERVIDAFAGRFEELGGELLAYTTFLPDSQDFSGAITRLFELDRSQQRQRALARTLGESPAFEARRRQDAEMVFIAAFPPQARQIRPQLRFHHAGELPVYATSHVFSGSVDRRQDRDMDGIIFPDMPWTIHPQEFPVIGELRELWGSRFDNRTRLYAMGYDAYRLVPLLRGGGSGFQGYFPGATGHLYLDENGEVRRLLRWAQFNRGVPDTEQLIAPAPALEVETAEP